MEKQFDVADSWVSPPLAIAKTADDSDTILKLNDDCLLALFEYFDLLDMSDVAEVCRRFQNIAKDTFSRSKRAKLKVPVDLMHTIHTQRNTVYDIFLRTSSTLRNFGTFITEIHGSSSGLTAGWRSQFEREFIRLLLQHCCGILTTLKLDGFNLKPDVMQDLRPLFNGLRKVVISFSERMPALPSSWFPELRELEFHDIGYSRRHNPSEDVDMVERSDFANQSYQNLERVVFSRVHELDNQDVETILKRSNKLKELKLYSKVFCDVYSTFFFGALAEHTPAIEKLDVCIIFDEPIVNHFSALQNLSSLTCRLDFLAEQQYSDHLILIIHNIAAVGIPLKYLHLQRLSVDENIPTFVGAVSKLEKLETLVLENCEDLNAIDLINICKSLRQMIEFRLTGAHLSAEDILAIVENGENLECLKLINSSSENVVADHRIDFDANALKKIVEKRLNKKHLHIELDPWYYNVSSRGIEQNTASLSY